MERQRKTIKQPEIKRYTNEIEIVKQFLIMKISFLTILFVVIVFRPNIFHTFLFFYLPVCFVLICLFVCFVLICSLAFLFASLVDNSYICA